MAGKSSIVLFCLAVACSSLAQGATQIGKDYSFSYTAGDSARDEAADSEGTVEGSYTYIDENGIERTVTYLASEGTGFVAEGEGIINVPQLIEDTRARRGPYEPSEAELRSWAEADRSYSLSYHAGDSARSEVSRPDGYVTGSYSYLDRDGNERIVEYEAGPGIGFRVKGDHIHPKIATASVPSDFDFPNLQLTEYTLRSGQVDYEPSNIQKVFNSDGSITYSYVAVDHSRSETVYPNGEVTGSYTYIAEDGQSHTVEYVGGTGIGFLASGNHISSSIGGASSSNIQNLVGSVGGGVRGSTVETTRTTETITGGSPPAVSTAALGTVGSTVTTTNTETVGGAAGGPFLLPSLVDEEEGNRRVVITTTTTGGSQGTGSSDRRRVTTVGGHRVTSSGLTSSQLQNILLGQQFTGSSGQRTGSSGTHRVVTTTTRRERPTVLASTADLVGQQFTGSSGQATGSSGTRRVVTTTTTRRERPTILASTADLVGQQFIGSSGQGTGSSGTRRVVTTTTTRRERPTVLASTADLVGSRLNGGSSRQTQTTVHLNQNQLRPLQLISNLRPVRPVGPVGPNYIKFSTPDGKNHEVNLDRLRNI